MPVHRRRFVPSAALLGLVASLLPGAGPVAAGARSYVALGDSYASGLGTRDYRPGAGACFRSSRAYPVPAVCDSPEWLNGLSEPLWDSYHPNRRGQRGHAALVATRLS